MKKVLIALVVVVLTVTACTTTEQKEVTVAGTVDSVAVVATDSVK
jgi:hypothetical protein